MPCKDCEENPKLRVAVSPLNSPLPPPQCRILSSWEGGVTELWAAGQGAVLNVFGGNFHRG